MNGKWYDLQVLSPNNTNFFISISKSGGKTNLRKKEKIITKILNDISKENFNFKYITTNFKKGWEKEVCKELLKLDKNG